MFIFLMNKKENEHKPGKKKEKEEEIAQSHSNAMDRIRICILFGSVLTSKTQTTERYGRGYSLEEILAIY